MLDWLNYAQYALEKSSVATESSINLQIELQRNGETFPAESTLLKYIYSGKPRKIVVWGRPGAGKSFLLDRINAQLASDLLYEIQNSPSDYSPSPTTVVPILIRLRSYTEIFSENQVKLDMTSMFSEELRQFGLSESLRDFFAYDVRFLFLIDDLDEVIHPLSYENLLEVKRFVNQFPTIPSIVAGRRIATKIFDSSREWVYQLSDLSPELISSAMAALLPSESAELQKILKQDPDLMAFLATPFFTLETVNYWKHSRHQNVQLRISKLLTYLLDELITNRQRRFDYYASVQTVLSRRLAVVQELAYESMLNQGEIQIRHMRQAQGDLEWFQHMDFVTQGSAPHFSNRWLQALFAAQHIQEIFVTHEERIAFWHEYLSPLSAIKTACIQVLSDLSGHSYAELLNITPKIKEQFTELEKKLISSNFEWLFADYARRVLGYREVIRGYNPQYMGNDEIDVYASKERNDFHTDVIVAECKYRIQDPIKKQVDLEELQQLLRKREKVNQELVEVEKRKSKTVSVQGILVVNGGGCTEQAKEFADGHKLWVWEIRYPVDAFLKQTGFSDNRISYVVGKPQRR